MHTKPNLSRRAFSYVNYVNPIIYCTVIIVCCRHITDQRTRTTFKERCWGIQKIGIPQVSADRGCSLLLQFWWPKAKLALKTSHGKNICFNCLFSKQTRYSNEQNDFSHHWKPLYSSLPDRQPVFFMMPPNVDEKAERDRHLLQKFKNQSLPWYIFCNIPDDKNWSHFVL